MNENVIINSKNGPIEMQRDTFIRWLCLIEIVDLADEKARDLKVNLDEYDWIKPVEFKKYMKARFKSMEIDLIADERNTSPISKIHHTVGYHSPTYQTQNA